MNQSSDLLPQGIVKKLIIIITTGALSKIYYNDV